MINKIQTNKYENVMNVTGLPVQKIYVQKLGVNCLTAIMRLLEIGNEDDEARGHFSFPPCGQSCAANPQNHA
jgi:hypothetical protein